MTTIEIDSSPHDIKISTKISTGTKIISIGKSPFLYLVFERRGRGSRGLSKYHRIKQIFVDKQNRAFAEIVMPDADGSGQSYKYAPVGRLLTPEEEGVI